jgi:7-dehydrocholesterol reductase
MSTVKKRSPTGSPKPNSKLIDEKKDAQGQLGKTWGRSKNVGFQGYSTYSNPTDTAIAFTLMATCPFLVVYFWSACDKYQCSLTAPVENFVGSWSDTGAIWKFVMDNFPTPTYEGFALYYAWLGFQALLYSYLPGKIGYGQKTPAGHELPYVVNGTLAWVVTHGLFITCSFGLGLFSPAIIHDHWGGLLIAANAQGYVLTAFSYVKAHLFPTHPEDRKFSCKFNSLLIDHLASVFFDLFWGIEFNPRIGELFDFKLFFNVCDLLSNFKRRADLVLLKRLKSQESLLGH